MSYLRPTSSSWLLITLDMTQQSLILPSYWACQTIPNSSCTFPPPGLESATYLRIPSKIFSGNWYFKTTIWVLRILTATDYVSRDFNGQCRKNFSLSLNNIFIFRSCEFLMPHEFTLSPIQIQDVLSNFFYITYVSPCFYAKNTWWRMIVLEYLTLHTSQDQNN